MSHSKSFTRVYECDSLTSADKGKKILSDKEVEELLLCAQEARVRAYTPYSKFRVGAALLTEDGSLVPGCNVENLSIGLTICAERNAIARAVGEGHRTFKAIGVVADMKDNFVTPCGACRQVIVEFTIDCEVYLGRPDGSYVKTTIDKLLPDAFQPHSINLERYTQ